MKFLSIVSVVFFLPVVTLGQSSAPDSIQKLNEVVVRAYFSEQPLLRSPSSVSVITGSDLRNHASESLVPALNVAPGVRMEERSPGSYRLSIRGSLLRSPFGVRNVRIYLDELPFTDAGGNTYLNSMDAASISGLTILKGAEASIYGANTGGVILIDPMGSGKDSTEIDASLSGGSFNSFHQTLGVQKKWKKYGFDFRQAYQSADGYRENSALNRLYGQLVQRWQYSPKAHLRNILLFSDLDYQTPGGLTRAQADQDPRAARAATATLPGAIQQQAGVANNTILAGLINEVNITNALKHVAAVSIAYTDFQNPFITNYETRKENTLSLRSYLEYEKQLSGWRWKANAGAEVQQTASDIDNYENLSGERGAAQSSDELTATQSFLFAHWMADFNRKFALEASASYNFYKFRYQTLFPLQTPANSRRLTPQFMPRVAASYQLNDYWALRTSISAGYSTPTIAEVRASDNIINTSLNPEKGWNYEAGIRFISPDSRWYMDANAFYFGLNDAIVRRVNEAEAEYFINAGGTKQRGVEFQASSWIIPQRPRQSVSGLQLRTSYTFSDFEFSDYINGNVNFEGNRLTGVPRHVVVTSLKLDLQSSFSIFGQHNFTSSIPLNDANSVYASEYHLVQLKGSWKHRSSKNRVLFETFAGIDNLLNVNYSLGNDLNAVGGRYFNYAAGRNYYAGIAIHFNK
ncbi:MAG TPA: TonB-dependent receptor [Sphingobacteriaceae bacterium]